jgi:molybdopterin molybdotransferase
MTSDGAGTMLTVGEARREVLGRCRPLPGRSVRLADAIGSVLAEEVAADLDLPPFDKALVDGYAVRSADLAGGAGRLRVVEEITAGRTPGRPLAAGEAAAIMTGAPLPEGADAVVMIEQTRRDGDDVIIDGGPVAPGQNRLTRGREMRAGEVVLRRGERLNAPRLGLLASIGRTEVRVIPRPRVAILPTGDELVEPDRVPGPGQIRNSNGTLLRALVGDPPAEVLPIAPDEPEGLRRLLARGLEADVLLITGGVSAGNKDLVPETLEALGVERVFHKVRLRPGKPLWFGVGPRDGDRPGPLVFGLPGNPVSGIIGVLLFVRPALEALQGREPEDRVLARQPLAIPFVHRGDRPTYHPARRVFNGSDLAIEPLDWAGSADLRTVARADGFALFPAGDRSYAAGEPIDYLPLP